MSNQVEDPFESENFDKAQETGEGVYFMEGSYPEVELIDMKLIKSFKGPVMQINTFKILKSEVPSRPAGMECSYVINFAQQPALKNARILVSKLTGEPFEKTSKDHCRAACNAVQPFRGSRLALVCTTRPTKTIRQTAQGPVQGMYTSHAFTLLAPGPKWVEMNKA